MLSKQNVRDIDDHLEALCLLLDNSGADRGVDVGIFLHALLLDIGHREGLKALDYVHKKWLPRVFHRQEHTKT
jgi:hypothetical protein